MPTQPASRPDHYQSADRNGRPGRHAPRRLNATLHIVPDGQRLRAEIRQFTTVGTVRSRRLARLARRTNEARGREREQEQPYEDAILQRILERIRNPDLIKLDQEELERGRQRYRRDRQRIVGDANSLRRRQGWLVPRTQAGNEQASPSANETASRASSGREGAEGASESFSDLERGQQRRGQPDQVALSSQGGEDKRFTSLADRIALQIFRITSNVKGIESLVKQLGGRNDNPELRSKLSNLTEATKDLVKSSTEDVKALANYDLSAQDAQTQQRKFRQARISRDFQTAILSYQNAAKLSAEKQRRYVDRAKAALDQGDDYEAREALSPGSGSRSQQQQQLQPVQTELVPDSELEYQEQLIQEREGEIEDIERGVLELNEIFRDLGTIVTEQQSMLDNIESNVISVANDTQGASEELISAHNYQKKAGRRMLYLLLIFIVVITIVLLAVLS